jgi:ferric-dicitrate binding protein FerR (iron transport regulator)
MVSHSDLDASERRLAEHAARWLVMFIDSDMLPKARADFAAWLKESPRHTEEFLMTMALWKELDSLDAERAVDLHQLLADVRPEYQSRPAEEPR